jgi:hypothetical protein
VGLGILRRGFFHASWIARRRDDVKGKVAAARRRRLV